MSTRRFRIETDGGDVGLHRVLNLLWRKRLPVVQLAFEDGGDHAVLLVVLECGSRSVTTVARAIERDPRVRSATPTARTTSLLTEALAREIGERN